MLRVAIRRGHRKMVMWYIGQGGSLDAFDVLKCAILAKQAQILQVLLRVVPHHLTARHLLLALIHERRTCVMRILEERRLVKSREPLCDAECVFAAIKRGFCSVVVQLLSECRVPVDDYVLRRELARVLERDPNAIPLVRELQHTIWCGKPLGISLFLALGKIASCADLVLAEMRDVPDMFAFHAERGFIGLAPPTLEALLHDPQIRERVQRYWKKQRSRLGVDAAAAAGLSRFLNGTLIEDDQTRVALQARGVRVFDTAEAREYFHHVVMAAGDDTEQLRESFDAHSDTDLLLPFELLQDAIQRRKPQRCAVLAANKKRIFPPFTTPRPLAADDVAFLSKLPDVRFLLREFGFDVLDDIRAASRSGKLDEDLFLSQLRHEFTCSWRSNVVLSAICERDQRTLQLINGEKGILKHEIMRNARLQGSDVRFVLAADCDNVIRCCAAEKAALPCLLVELVCIPGRHINLLGDVLTIYDQVLGAWRDTDTVGCALSSRNWCALDLLEKHAKQSDVTWKLSIVSLCCVYEAVERSAFIIELALDAPWMTWSNRRDLAFEIGFRGSRACCEAVARYSDAKRDHEVRTSCFSGMCAKGALRELSVFHREEEQGKNDLVHDLLSAVWRAPEFRVDLAKHVLDHIAPKTFAPGNFVPSLDDTICTCDCDCVSRWKAWGQLCDISVDARTSAVLRQHCLNIANFLLRWPDCAFSSLAPTLAGRFLERRWFELLAEVYMFSPKPPKLTLSLCNESYPAFRRLLFLVFNTWPSTLLQCLLRYVS